MRVSRRAGRVRSSEWLGTVLLYSGLILHGNCHYGLDIPSRSLEPVREHVEKKPCPPSQPWKTIDPNDSVAKDLKDDEHGEDTMYQYTIGPIGKSFSFGGRISPSKDKHGYASESKCESNCDIERSPDLREA